MNIEGAGRIRDAFKELLDERVDPPTLVATAPGTGQGFLVAVDGFANMYLLVPAADQLLAPRTIREFGSIVVTSAAPFDLIVDGAERRAAFAGLMLSGQRRDLMTAFAFLSEAVLAALPEVPTQFELDAVLGDFAELFSRADHLDPGVVKGLWGELWFLSTLSDASFALSAWHPAPTSRFDFGISGFSVEVKTHEGERASHNFSHLQLITRPSETWVVSVRIYSDGGGKSLASMVDSFAGRLAPQERRRFLSIVFGTLGTDLESLDDYRFALSGDLSRVAVLASDVPVVSYDPELPISDVRYRVDITEVLARDGLSLPDLLAKLGLQPFL